MGCKASDCPYSSLSSEITHRFITSGKNYCLDRINREIVDRLTRTGRCIAMIREMMGTPSLTQVVVLLLSD